MISSGDLAQLWNQIVTLEAECELTERWLERVSAERGHSSPEALAVSYRLDGLKERLYQMDKKYSAFLKNGDWQLK